MSYSALIVFKMSRRSPSVQKTSSRPSMLTGYNPFLKIKNKTCRQVLDPNFPLVFIPNPMIAFRFMNWDTTPSLSLSLPNQIPCQLFFKIYSGFGGNAKHFFFFFFYLLTLFLFLIAFLGCPMDEWSDGLLAFVRPALTLFHPVARGLHPGPLYHF